jgi:hypothetical protein
MILERFCLQDAKSTPIPMNGGTILSMDQSPSTSDEINEMGEIPYQRGIGSLMYATTSTRPDIAFPVAILSQFMRNLGSGKRCNPLPKGYGGFNSNARRISPWP